jgi:CubicO group peptidase (beta-lactamase class C family)
MDQSVKPALIEKLSEGVSVPPQMIENMGFGIAAEYGKHYAQPAGGLYSTASDVGKFCQMLLNGGVWEGKRYLSEAAIQQMSIIQTGEAMKSPNEGYGLGWAVKKKEDEGLPTGSFGHRGARRTVMWVDSKDQLVMVLLVQRMDMNGEQQKEMYGSFLRAAVEKYGKPSGGATSAQR